MSRPASAEGGSGCGAGPVEHGCGFRSSWYLLLSPAIYSSTRMAMLPSSLPLGVRTVEWLRMHHFNWLVDETEHVYYSWQTPAKGGAQLKTLPTVGFPRQGESARQGEYFVAAAHPAGLRPPAARRGDLEADGPRSLEGRPSW